MAKKTNTEEIVKQSGRHIAVKASEFEKLPWNDDIIDYKGEKARVKYLKDGLVFLYIY